MAFGGSTKSTAARVVGWACATVATLVATAAGAQDLYARGDATCSLTLTAADVVAEIRALGGASLCGNDDCNRDGAVTAADVECAATCLFGTCAVPPNAPQVTGIAADSAPAIVPFSAIRITSANLGAADHLKQVTIGGLNALVAEVDPPDTLVVIVPGGLPPGPADVVVYDGDLAGAPVSLTVEPAQPIGTPDTFDGTLDLLDTTASLLLALDLDAALGTDATALRQSLQALRTNLAAERAALNADPQFTPALRAQLDAAFEGSGTPEMLRDVIAEIEDVLAPSVQRRASPIDPAASGASDAIAKTGRIVSILGGLAAASAAAFSAPVAAGIALTLGITAGVVTYFGTGMGADAPMAPSIVAVEFFDAEQNPVTYPLPGGIIKITANYIEFNNAELLVFAAQYGTTLSPSQPVGGSIEFALPDPNSGNFCGNVQFVLRDKTKNLGSRFINAQVQPITLGIDPSTDGYIGQPLGYTTRGALGCPELASAVFSGGPGGEVAQSVDGGQQLHRKVPDIAPGAYTTMISVASIRSAAAYPFTIKDLLAPTISCERTTLALPPTDPAQPAMDPKSAACHAVSNPADVPFPDGTLIHWQSSNSSVASFSTSESRPPDGTNVVAILPGTTMVTATYEHKATMETTENGIGITVADESPPTLSVSSSPAPGKVNPGSTIQVTAKAQDNFALRSIDVVASGDAIAGDTSQHFTCGLLDEECDTDFSFPLKDSGFMNSEVSITVSTTDRTGFTATADPLAFTLKQDTICPFVTIDSPADGSAVDAGSTVQVTASATDDAPDDTGVKSFTYSASGDSLVAPVSQVLPFPKPLETAQLHFSFTVKQAADLAMVTHKTIIVSVAAADAAIPPNQCAPETIALAISGMLNNCQGTITTDNSAGFDGEPFTITVTLSGDAASKVTKVTSNNPDGQFDLAPQGNGVYTVTLNYTGEGSFTLTFLALDATGNTLCSGSIGLTALGPAPELLMIEPASVPSQAPAGAMAVR